MIKLENLKEMLEEHQKIVCLLNIYKDNIGNCTMVIFNDGKEIRLNQSAKSTLRNIAKHYVVDIKQLQKKQQKLLNAKYYTPLPINKNMLFICIKTRQPRVEKDPCVSYINFYEIDKLDKKLPIIHMKNGQRIKSLDSIKTLNKRYNQGEICAKLQNDEYKHSLIIEEESVPYFYPATKRDIQEISQEIEDIKNLLKNILVSKKS